MEPIDDRFADVDRERQPFLSLALAVDHQLAGAPVEIAQARTKAIPADDEIKTVRALIGAGEGALAELAPDEKATLLELFRVLRATRAQMNATIDIRTIATTRTPEPTFTPPAFTPLSPAATNPKAP